MLVEVTSLEVTRNKVVAILESQGYDYFWRPTWGDDIPPFYAWFIKRDVNGKRTHHIHMIEKGALFVEHWDRLLFSPSSSEQIADASDSGIRLFLWSLRICII